MSVNQMKTQQGPSPLGIVSICLHTLQIIIKKREKLQCAVYFPSSLDLMLGAYWHLHQCIDSLHLCAVRLWPGGQQTRLSVPTGTPTAGLYHTALFARSHLDRHPAHLHPWVLVHHALLLYLCITLFSHFALWHLVTAYLHCWLFSHFLFFSSTLSLSLAWCLLPIQLVSFAQSWHNFWPPSRLQVTTQSTRHPSHSERERGVDRDYCYTDWTIFTLNQCQTRLCTLSQ